MVLAPQQLRQRSTLLSVEDMVWSFVQSKTQRRPAEKFMKLQGKETWALKQ